MIKPIIYRDMEEKEILERKLMSAIPMKKRKLLSSALMDIFYRHVKKRKSSKRKQ